MKKHKIIILLSLFFWLKLSSLLDPIFQKIIWLFFLITVIGMWRMNQKGFIK
jgi:hypothetical protein